MGVPTSEVGYTPATPRREDHEVHNGYVVVLGGGEWWDGYIKFRAVCHDEMKWIEVALKRPPIGKIYGDGDYLSELSLMS